MSLVQLMETSWLNPFSPDQEELVSLSTAAAAPADVARNLLDAKKIGEQAYRVFKEENLQADATSGQFHHKITKKKLKTFSDIRKKSRSQGHGKEVVLNADRKLIGQMILVAKSRTLHMSDVLAHPLGLLPWALANGDGTLRKTNKAALARELEKSVSAAEVIP